MNEFLDSILGFLPQRAVFWTALGSALIVLLFQYVTQKLEKIVKLPYMEEENQKKRKIMLGQSSKDQQ
ncbi:hypothetical protein BTR23_09035 [Alkalihalophilus pseudofirmus]|nr:hypothetical protein BTR23_09035 [Alkalihalophilus pseudofirmus]